MFNDTSSFLERVIVLCMIISQKTCLLWIFQFATMHPKNFCRLINVGYVKAPRE